MEIKRSNSITQASFLVFVTTVLSKIIAYLESVIVAAYFGTSGKIDMFYLANSISIRFAFTIFASLSIAVVTMYNSTLSEGGVAQGNRFISSLLKIVLPAAVILSVLLFMLSPLIANIMTRNYDGNENEVLCLYIRVLSAVGIFYVLGVVFTAVLNANKMFVPGALVGTIQNVTLIIFVIVLSPSAEIWSVVIGFLSGYIIQAFFLYICTRRVFRYEKNSIKNDLDIKKMMVLVVPLILGDATGEINMLVDQFVSTGLGKGYVSALSYSESLDGFVTSFFIQTISTVLLPFFSILATEKKYDEMSRQIRTVINMLVLILIPVTIITVINATDIVSIVYQRGNFDISSVNKTAYALMGYGIGFVFRAVFIVTRRPFYAIEDTKVPMYLTMVSVVINIFLTVILSNYLGVFGVTFATTIAFIIGDIFAILIMNRKIPGAKWAGEAKFLIKAIFSGLISALLVYIVSINIYASSFIRFIISTVICFGVYSLFLWVFKTSEFSYLFSTVVRKMRFKL